MYRESIKKYDVIFLIVVACAQFYWLFEQNGIQPEVALTDVLISYGLLYGLILIVKYSHKFHFFFYSFYFSIGLQSFFFSWVWIAICKDLLVLISPSETNYLELWQKTFLLRGLIGWIVLSCFTFIYFLSRELKQKENSIQEEQQAAKLRKDAELFKLRQQLQPHFLFNSLNSINALIGREPQTARQMMQQLSEYLRNSLRKEDDDFISFREEMSDLRLYLAIEQMRFGSRLNLKEELSPDCDEQKIPPFLLQPLVENAVKYGLYGTTGMVTLHISAQKLNDEFVFSMSNPFDESSVIPQGTGFGLDSVKRRLYLLYARNDLLKITKSLAESEFERENKLQIFTVKLIIPNQLI